MRTTIVGAIRVRVGEVALSPTRTNPHHATVSGLMSEQASDLFLPTIANPSRRKKTQE
jgi:hypothetical protein